MDQLGNAWIRPQSQNSHPGLISLRGRDARDFLHRLTTLDLAQLTPGSGALGFFLRPTGRIRAPFFLWVEDAEHFLLEYEIHPALDGHRVLLETLEDLHFRERLEIIPRDDLECWWQLGSPTQIALSISQPGLYRTSGPGLVGIPHFSVWGNHQTLSQLTAPNGTILEERERDPSLEIARIHSLTPRIGQEILLEANPLELGLDQDIADQKGCYPGQETIERIRSLGAPAQRLVGLRGSPSTPTGPVRLLSSEGEEVGTITSMESGSLAGAVEPHLWALALLKKKHAVPGNELQLIPTIGAPLAVQIHAVSPFRVRY